MKKMHFRVGGARTLSLRKGKWFWTTCSMTASEKKTTEDRTQVTCLLCLKKLGATRSEAVRNVAAAVTPAAPTQTLREAHTPPAEAGRVITIDGVTVRCIPNEKGNPPGKLGDVELHFNGGGLFDGLKLIGFAVWERRTGGGRNVTFPARQYAVNGERRSFALLRPVTDTAAQERLRDFILTAWTKFELETQEVR